jgi:hypothetical protein
MALAQNVEEEAKISLSLGISSNFLTNSSDDGLNCASSYVV